MVILFSCPHCGMDLEAMEDVAGRNTVCPCCKNDITIPALVEWICPHCGNTLRAKQRDAGITVVCWQCTQIAVVPAIKEKHTIQTGPDRTRRE